MRPTHRFLGVLLSLILLSASIVPSGLAPLFAETASAPALRAAAVDRALAWLHSMQQADGSFASDPGITIEGVLAIAAAGQDAALWTAPTTGLSPLDYLSSITERYAADVAGTGKLVAGIVAAGYDPRAFAGHDLVARLSQLVGTADARTTLELAWAILGLLAAREPLPQATVEALAAAQQPDGGWEGAPGWGTDSNITALALQALIGAGIPPAQESIARGRGYLAAQQSPTGGFTYSAKFGTVADADSTAYVFQGLLAIGENPLAAPWLKGDSSPLDDLLRFQRPNGAFEWQLDQGDNLLATAQAIPALLGKPLPLKGASPAIRSALAYLRSVQQADGSFASGFGTNLVPSAQVLMALAVAGEAPQNWRGSNGASLLDYLRREAVSIQDAGAAGLLTTALVLARENPRVFGADLVAMIKGAYDPATGAFDPHQNIYNHCLALWGLVAAGEAVPAQAVVWLKQQQNQDGGWGWAGGQKSDSNSTAVALQALLGSGLSSQDPSLSAAIAYLHRQQAQDGGFVYDIASGSTSDADSTAYVMQALLAAGSDPAWIWALPTAATLHKPVDALLALQQADGSFEWQAGSGANLLATVQAIPALARATFPAGRILSSGRDAAHPIALGDNIPIYTALVGSRPGAFAYYSLDYPGNDRPITIRVQYAPPDVATSRGFGFNLFAPDGRLLGRGTTPGGSPPSILELRLSGSASARWLVQFYNYLPGDAVSYSVVAQGLASGASASAAARPAPNADPGGAIALETSASGEIVGRREGSYAFFKLDYPGNDAAATLHLTFTPADVVSARGVGFVVYSPMGEIIRGQATSAYGVRQVSWSSGSRGIYLIQVYNYVEGVTVRYTLSREG